MTISLKISVDLPEAGFDPYSCDVVHVKQPDRDRIAMRVLHAECFKAAAQAITDVLNAQQRPDPDTLKNRD